MKKLPYLCIVCGENNSENFYSDRKKRCKVHQKIYDKELRASQPNRKEVRRKAVRKYHNKKISSIDEKEKQDYINKRKKIYRKRWFNLISDVVEMYGGKCSCCGESERHFLSLDHVNNNGAEERKTTRNSAVYAKLRKEGISDQYQILCMNCNFGKYRNGGICPHKKGKEKITE